MSTFQIILVVVALFYVAEILVALPPTGVIFRSLSGRRYRAHLAFESGFRIRDTFYMVLTSWLPWGRAFVTEIAPFRMRGDFLAPGAGWTPPPCPPAEPMPWRSWADLSTAQRDGALVLMNDGHRQRTATPAAARDWVTVIRELSSSSDQQRQGRLQQWWRERFDLAAIRADVERYDAATRQVRLLSTLLVIFVFGVLGVFSFTGSPVVWSRLALVYVGLLLAIQVATFQAYRVLLPDARGTRYKKVLAMLISPAEAMAAPHALARDVLSARDPLAVGRVLLSTADASAMAHRWARGLHYGGHLDAAELERYVTFLEREGMAPSSVRPPEREESCMSYCPRCHEQLTIKAGLCPSCTTVEVQPFPVGEGDDPA